MTSPITNFLGVKVEYGPETLATMGKQVKMLVGGEPIKMQVAQQDFDPVKDFETLPKVPFGVSASYPGSDPGRRKLDLVVDDKKIVEVFQGFDEQNIKEVVKRSKELLGKEMDEKAVKDIFTPSVKVHPDGKYDPIVPSKLQLTGDKKTSIVVAVPGDEFTFYEGTVDDIEKGSRVLVVVETSGLWFKNRRFGMSFKVTDMVVWKPVRKRGIDAFGFAVKTTKVARED